MASPGIVECVQWSGQVQWRHQGVQWRRQGCSGPAVGAAASPGGAVASPGGAVASPGGAVASPGGAVASSEAPHGDRQKVPWHRQWCSGIARGVM